MALRLASVSVDLDSLHHYCRIHGLPESLLDEHARRLVYTVAVPRLRQVLGGAGVPATLFAIGEDLADPAAAQALAEACRAGWEVASHSFSHDYALALQPPGAIREDLRRAEEAIATATGQRPVGFRAPGYTLTPALYQATAERGYRYGSSAFPAAPYYAAKALVMGALALAGRPSRAVLDSPRVLLAPRTPYRPDPAQPYRRGHGPLLELPMAVTPRLRLPFIGTFLTTLPLPALRTAWQAFRQDTLFNLELHAVDVLDVSDGIPPRLARHQRDLHVPAAQKLERLATVLSWMRAERELMTLQEAAGRLSVEL